nr:immunoglobulin light chain junction region [Macaca mulatta]
EYYCSAWDSSLSGVLF